MLTVQNALLANEAALVDSTAQVSLSLVELYGSLGGGWQGYCQAFGGSGLARD